MGMHPYDAVSAHISTARVPTTASMSSVDADKKALSTKLDMRTNVTCSKDMGGACVKMNPVSQYRQSTKSASRNKNRRNMSIKRCKKVRGVDQIDSSLLDDFYNSQTKCILSKISDWSFDVFALEKASNGRALFHVVLKLFHQHNLINHFKLDVVKLMTFATLVEEGYQSNPYHNSTHAADVTQAMHCYITQGKIAKHMTPLEIMIALVSAITHDLDHPGVNQGFLVATNNHLANLYENKAVLEKHHWRSALAVLHQTGLFDHLSESVRSKIEIEMKSLILATDMTRQQDFLAALKARVEANTLSMAEYEDRHFILQIALKCADISNPCRHWSACKSWSEKVCDEFFRQGDFERELDLDISNLCDRYSNTIPRIQTGFIDFCVEPLFTEFEKYLFPCSMLSEQLTNLKLNRQKWQEKIDSLSKPLATRPTNLTIPLSVDTSVSEIPSPTVSEGGDLPSPTESESCDSDFAEASDVVISLNRRHSFHNLPLLLDTKHLLARRQSFPDGPCKGGSNDTVKLVLLDPSCTKCRLADDLSGINNNIVCRQNDKQLSNILENIFTKSHHSSGFHSSGPKSSRYLHILQST